MRQMIVVFEDPKTGADREFKFDPQDIDVVQARYIKRNANLTPSKLFDALGEGDPDALVALYWLMLAQNGVSADMGKLNFKLGKFAAAMEAASEAEKEAREEAGVEENPTEAPATA